MSEGRVAALRVKRTFQVAAAARVRPSQGSSERALCASRVHERHASARAAREVGESGPAALRQWTFCEATVPCGARGRTRGHT